MYVIYHSRDLDGFTSGTICLKKYPDAIAIGYDYGQPFPFEELEENVPIIMVDVSLPISDMAKLGMHTGNKLTWIDHHISAIEDYKQFSKSNPALGSFIQPVFGYGIAACETAWGYLFPYIPMPLPVKLLGMYDTFRNENTDYWEKYVLPFQYGMRCMNINSAESFPQALLSEDETYFNYEIPQIIHSGKIALDYQRNIDRANMLNSFEIEFEGLRAICCNGSGFGSMAFDSVWDAELHDVMMPYKHNGSQWTFSLYSPKDEVDCSALAKKYGGGGHKGAAGFVTDQLPDFIKS